MHSLIWILRRVNCHKIYKILILLSNGLLAESNFILKFTSIFAVDDGRFCVCVGLPVQMHAEQIEVGGHFVSLSRKFNFKFCLSFDARIWPHFHVKISRTQVPSLQHTN